MAVTRGSDDHDGTELPHGGPAPLPSPAPTPAPVSNSIRDSTIHGPVIMAGSIGDLRVTVQQVTPVAPSQQVVGRIPLLASAFQSRTATREAIERARRGSETVVLTQLLSGAGGVGKSQLAAYYAGQAVAEGIDVVVWADAGDASAVTGVYARAAVAVRAPGVVGDVASTEQDAECFLNWLAGTERSWLVVLDNVTDFGAGGLWPSGSRNGNGRVLATTRRRDAAASAAGRTLVDVDRYSGEEAAAYLRERLTQAGRAQLLDDRADELAEALGRLPLALGHAAAHMINTGCTTGAYLTLLTRRSHSLDTVLPASADAENYGRPVTAALLLALDAAQRQEPRGLAVPAMRLAAVFDPSGHPRELWTTEAVTRYLTRHRTIPPEAAEPGRRRGRRRGKAAGAPVSADEALRAVAVLHNYNLLSDQGPAAGSRAVGLHALTARAALDTTPDHGVLYRVAAAGLVELWPAEDHTDRELAAALRSSTDTLAELAGDGLWRPDSLPVLYRAAESLFDAGLFGAAVAQWERIAAKARDTRGHRRLETRIAQGQLAVSCLAAGRAEDAIGILETLLGNHRRSAWRRHPDLIAARANLVDAYRSVGRTEEAVRWGEQVVAASERLRRPRDPELLSRRSSLAGAYFESGRTGEAIAMLEQILVETERLLGPDHPDTLTARHNLASCYGRTGRRDEAIRLEEQVVAAAPSRFGAEHPHHLSARSSLGASYTKAGRTEEAVDELERVVADSERVLGAEDQQTLTARAHLAEAYARADRTGAAVTLLEQVLAVEERLLGPDHRTTHTTRSNLAVHYAKADRVGDAVTLQQRVLADGERLLAPDDPNTGVARGNLVYLLLRRGRERLPDDPQAALWDTVAALDAAGPLLAADPGGTGWVPESAYRLAADAFNHRRQPALATEFRQWAWRRHDRSRHPAAAASDAAVRIRRALAPTHPAAQLPELRGSHHQAMRAADQGSRATALACVVAAVRDRPSLADAYLPSLAWTLDALTARPPDPGSQAELLPAVAEAVEATASLDSIPSDAHLCDLALNLTSLALWLHLLDRTGQARSAAEDAHDAADALPGIPGLRDHTSAVLSWIRAAN
ncbi:tetratricopeptide repeat protein [Streptomyces sp. NPDC057579]|uniref:tetratricopeptide repeat protein n=1 Tax=Streptomyces sp. NPDC057579 TaxID=3346172 RepID=UPI0036BF26F7